MDRGTWWGTYSPWDHKESDKTEGLSFAFYDTQLGVSTRAHWVIQSPQPSKWRKVPSPLLCCWLHTIWSEERLWFLSSELCSVINLKFFPGSVQFSRSVMSDSLWPHELQHSRPPCPSPTPRVHPNPCPLSRWCLPTISSSVVPFPSCPQSFPPSGSFQMSQLSTSGGQIIGVSASTSVPPMNTQDWSPLEWTG